MRVCLCVCVCVCVCVVSHSPMRALVGSLLGTTVTCAATDDSAVTPLRLLPQRPGTTPALAGEEKVAPCKREKLVAICIEKGGARSPCLLGSADTLR